NIPNDGYITNLRADAVVEVPAIVCADRIIGLGMGELPPAIAALMELMNELHACEPAMSASARRECAEKVTLLLAPFAPFAAQELWEILGHSTPAFREKWPEFDENLAREEELEVPVQVNGRLRSRISVPHGTPVEEQQRIALADPRVRAHTDGRQIVRVIHTGRLINIVVKG
ncbi:MAG: class I tRNA ligase family protein, partial [Bryobacteraceae bacterium]